MVYLKSAPNSSLTRYYAILSKGLLFDNALVVDHCGYFFSVKKIAIVDSKATPCTKEEFESAYDNAIKSFLPFMDKKI